MFKILLTVVLMYVYYSSFSQYATFPFNAVYDNNKSSVNIRWRHSSINIKTYSIQRSVDNKAWADIALQGINTGTGNKEFYFEDKNARGGENYYRMKWISVDGRVAYSQSILVIIPAASGNWIMYPVPVKDLLTLQYNGTEKIKGVISIFIQQATGRIITRFRSSSLSKTIQIPVDNLGRGIYDIRIVIQGEVVWNQRFVK